MRFTLIGIEVEENSILAEVKDLGQKADIVGSMVWNCFVGRKYRCINE